VGAYHKPTNAGVSPDHSFCVLCFAAFWGRRVARTIIGATSRKKKEKRLEKAIFDSMSARLVRRRPRFCRSVIGPHFSPYKYFVWACRTRKTPIFVGRHPCGTWIAKNHPYSSIVSKNGTVHEYNTWVDHSWGQLHLHNLCRVCEGMTSAVIALLVCLCWIGTCYSLVVCTPKSWYDGCVERGWVESRYS